MTGTYVLWVYNENFGTGPKMANFLKIWHGQEKTIKDERLWHTASSQDKRTVIEAVHVLDRQGVSRWV